MRLARLELIAFGHFRAKVLDFDEVRAATTVEAVGPGVHVVYGDNEAGKSTALRAIRALMYGVAVQTSDAFLHAQADLRIGAEWVNDAGERLYLARRKGRKHTLLDREGNPLDDALWSQWLGGVDETLFVGMFGLNHETLRQGAQSLLSGEGKAAESLFGASMGTGEVRRVLSELGQGAEELYTPKSRTKRINQEIAELKRIKAQLAADSISPAAYAEQEQALKQERAREAEAVARRTRLRTEHARLERLLRLLPLVAQRAQFQAERAQLGHVADLPRDSEQRRLSRERARDEAGQRLAHEQSEMERVQRRLANLSLERELLDIDSETLESLSLGLGGHRKAQIDLPKRESELKTLQSDALRIFESLHTELPFERASELGLTDNEQVRLKRLSKEKTQFETKLADAAGKLKKAESQVSALRKELQHLPELPAARGLGLALARASRSLAVEETLQPLRGRVTELDQRVSSLRARLLGVLTTASADLPTLPVPGRETLARFEKEFEQLQRSSAELEQEQHRLQGTKHDIEAQLQELDASFDVPQTEQLHALRTERDAMIRALGADPSVGAMGTALSLALQADAYADRMFKSASAVTRRAGLLAQRAALDGKLGQLEQARAARSSEAQQVERAWLEVWRGIGITPKTPREMNEWLHGHAEISKLVHEREMLVKQLHEAEGQIGLAFEELSTQLVAVDQAPRQLWEQRLAQLLERAEQTERRLQNERTARSDRTRQLELEEEKCQQLAQELSELKETERVWRATWQKALKLVYLERDAGPDEVLSMLEQHVQLQHKLKEIEVMLGRIQGMRRDSERLGATVKRLLTPNLKSYAEHPIEEACETLIREARKARTQAEERERLERELEQRSSRAELANLECTRADADLAQLMQRAGVSDLAALARAEEAAARARTLADLIAESESKIVAMGEGASLAELIEQTRGSDAAQVRAQLLELEPQLSATDDSLDQARTAAVRLEQQLERWQAGASAVAEELASATASLQRSVKDYMRLRFAFVLLQQEVERYREQHQGPVLSAASDLFVRLTLGAYTGLKVGFDAKDQQILLCVNKEGRQVETQRLSDGARDQLYLALRVASLERYLEQHPAVPLVLDDILVHFDDARAGAALEVLGELSKRVQILFFTHHRRMLELARSRLDPKVLHVHELGAQNAV